MDHRTPSFFSTLTRQKSCSNDEDDDTRRERSSRFSSIVCSLDRKGKERENGKLDGLNSFIRWRVSHTVEEKVVQHESHRFVSARRYLLLEILILASGFVEFITIDVSTVDIAIFG